MKTRFNLTKLPSSLPLGDYISRNISMALRILIYDLFKFSQDFVKKGLIVVDKSTNKIQIVQMGKTSQNFCQLW